MDEDECGEVTGVAALQKEEILTAREGGTVFYCSLNWCVVVKMSSGGGKVRVGKYELGRTLGEGTFGKVKFARNARTGENVAIKILDKEKIIRHKMVNQV